MTRGSVLVDTNILVCTIDRRDPAKQRRAAEVLRELADAGAGVLSVQTLAEYFAAVTTKQVLAAQVSLPEAIAHVEDYAASWPVLDVTPAIVVEATQGVRRHGFPYWDAQLWATARLNQIPTVYSEDFADGTRIGGVTFHNPLAEETGPYAI